MAYQIQAEFVLPLPEDLAQMGHRIAEVTEAWQAFCSHAGPGFTGELRLVQPREGRRNGAPVEVAAAA